MKLRHLGRTPGCTGSIETLSNGMFE